MPTDSDFLKEATIGYIAMGREADARKMLIELRKAPLDERQSLETASLLLQVHENESAIRIFQEWRDKQSWRATLEQYDLARAYLAGGKYDKVVHETDVYTTAARIGETKPPQDLSAKVLSVRGIVYAQLNQRDLCVDAFSQAARLDSKEEEYWLNLTRELMEFGRYPEAIGAVQDGLAANPKSYALHLRMGAAYLAGGQLPEAERVFRELVNAGDPLPTGYVGLAQVLLRTGRPDEAASVLAAAEKTIGPQFLLSYFHGLALDHAGKSFEALGAFQNATKLNPKSAEAHLDLGKTELTLGHLQEAIAELQEALRLDPENAPAKRILSQAYRRAGDQQNAVKFAEASAGSPVLPAEGNLLGDLFVPGWVFPVSNIH
jgi:tetratricopeptide (TPR) repeat protein